MVVLSLLSRAHTHRQRKCLAINFKLKSGGSNVYEDVVGVGVVVDAGVDVAIGVGMR